MSAGAPWSVKGIDPKAREIAKDLARRQGMTLGDWQAFWRWRNAGEYDRMMANREHTIKVVKETYFKINPIGTDSYKVKRPFPRTSRIGMKVGTLGVSEQFAAQKEKQKSLK